LAYGVRRGGGAGERGMRAGEQPARGRSLSVSRVAARGFQATGKPRRPGGPCLSSSVPPAGFRATGSAS